jgi:hypothetical protein
VQRRNSLARQCRSNVRSARNLAGGDGAARHPYHHAKHIPAFQAGNRADLVGSDSAALAGFSGRHSLRVLAADEDVRAPDRGRPRPQPFRVRLCGFGQLFGIHRQRVQ